MPAYATELSAGMDIRANLSEPIALEPLQRCLVPPQVCIALPAGFEAQIRPPQRFGYQERYLGIELSGTIDADYRGEICIILVNLSSETFMIEMENESSNGEIARHGAGGMAGGGCVG